jgi:hypothetical protein
VAENSGKSSAAEWQAIVDRVWPDVRRRHLFPELPKPVVSEEDGVSSVDMTEKQITLSLETSELLARHVPKEVVVSALLDHATAHHTVCPWDFDSYLKLYGSLKPIVRDGDTIKRILDYFTDVVSDTHAVRESASQLPEVYRHLDGGDGFDVIRALYQRIWGEPLGAEGDADTDQAVSRLERIPYLDRSKWLESVRSFASVMQPYVIGEMSSDGDDSDGGMLGPHGPGQYSQEEIEKGLSAFAEQGYHAFRAMVEDFRIEIEDAGAMPEKGIGHGRGVPRDADILYYMKRAEAYRLPVKPTNLEKVGGMYPHTHTPWEIGKPVYDIDVWTSFGKILPGISQTWQRREGETHGVEDGTPDCLILIDSSGSMANPCDELSHAVLGAGCAADAYLRRRRQVAVYNFSDAPQGGVEKLDFTENRDAIYRTLCRYFGGGTELSLDDFKSFDRRRMDIFIITDMQISNLGSVIRYLGSVAGRVTAVHVGQTREADQFRSSTESEDHIVVYAVDTPEDIPGIVLAEAEGRFAA